MQLGQLSGNRGRALAQDFACVKESLRDAMRRFVKD